MRRWAEILAADDASEEHERRFDDQGTSADLSADVDRREIETEMHKAELDAREHAMTGRERAADQRDTIANDRDRVASA